MKMILILSVLFVGCGKDEQESAPVVSKFKTKEGWLCVHRSDDKTTLCYDESGNVTYVGDPNGVFD